MEPGVAPFAPARVNQFSPVATAALALNETAVPVVVVTGSVCEANELPATPWNSSTGTEEMRSGSAERLRTTATFAVATPGLVKAIFPRYCPAARPDGLICTVSVDG